MRTPHAPHLFAQVTAGRAVRSSAGSGIRIVETLHGANTHLAEHAHDDVTIDVLIDGEMVEHIGRRTMARPPYSLLIKPAATAHANTYGGVTTRSVVLQCALTSPILAEWRGPMLSEPKLVDGERARAFVNILSALLKACDAPEALFVSETAALALESLARSGGQARRVTARTSDKALKAARDALLDAEGHTDLASLAARCGLGPSAFTHAFRRRFGCTPSALVRRWRLECAVPLLLDRTLSLSMIAARCGFADHAHFSREFRRLVGRSPRDVRSSPEPVRQLNCIQDARPSFG